MLKIRFGGNEIPTTKENLDRVVDLIIRARSANLSASIDSNFVIGLIKELLELKKEKEAEKDEIDLMVAQIENDSIDLDTSTPPKTEADEEIIDLDDLLLSDGEDASDLEPLLLGEESIKPTPQKIQVEEFIPYSSEDIDELEVPPDCTDSEETTDLSEELDEIEVPENKIKAPLKGKGYIRSSYWLDQRTARIWVTTSLVAIIGFCIIVCLSYF